MLVGNVWILHINESDEAYIQCKYTRDVFMQSSFASLQRYIFFIVVNACPHLSVQAICHAAGSIGFVDKAVRGVHIDLT